MALDNDCGCDPVIPAPSYPQYRPPLPRPSSDPCDPPGSAAGAVWLDEWTAPDCPPVVQPPTPSFATGSRPDPSNPFGNEPLTWTGNRTDCPPGQKGAPYSYSLPANSFKSKISVADANKKARAWLAVNGPTLASLYSGCIPATESNLTGLVFSGVSGCSKIPLANLRWGRMDGQTVTGCAQQHSKTKFKNVIFEGITGCPGPETLLFGLTFGDIECN